MLYSGVVPATLVGNCCGHCLDNKRHLRSSVIIFLCTAEMLREFLYNKAIRQVLRQFTSLLHVQRVASVQGGVKDIGRMSTFAHRDLDGIFFVGFTSAIVALIQLERYVGCVVKLRDPAIRDGQTRQKDKIDQRVYVALFGEITGKRAPAMISSFFKVLDYFSE